jgi:CubicO group peptidase (beta-lactamase class C family)
VPPTWIPHSALIAALALALGACSSGDDDDTAAPTEETPATSAPDTTLAPAPPTPGAEWEVVDPAAVGLDGAKLEELANVAEAGKSNCFLVVRDGKIAGEWYFRDTNEHSAQEVFSASKSFASTLVGIAQDDGDLTISQSASTWIDEWKGTPAEAVTVRNLLSNDSGREWSLALDYVQMLQAEDRTAFAVGLGQPDPPGTVWVYNNSAIQTLQRVLQGATGEEVTEFAEDRLFEPLGMRDTDMTTDVAGNALMFMGVQSTCRDMARFGVLALNRGNWGGEQIVSDAWWDGATGTSSTIMNAAYGYLWWLNREGFLAGATAPVNVEVVESPDAPSGQLVPDAPEDMFWAQGLGNQIIQVDPGSRTVVVRLGTGEPQPQPPTFGRNDAARVVTEAVLEE